MRRLSRPEALFLCAYAVFLLALMESAARWTDLDLRLIKPLLYTQAALPELHMPSPDPERVFELRPGARTAAQGNSYSVNRLGLRGREPAPVKRRGVRRIVFLGGSNTFGAVVGDQQTYPARLEALLERRYPGRFEVWNAGVSAFVLAQEVSWARSLVERHSVDLLVFQRRNAGRRAFLPGQDLRPYFKARPELYPENLRFYPSGAGAGALFRGSALFRSLIVGLNRCPWVRGSNPRYNGEDENRKKFLGFYDEVSGSLPVFVLFSRDDDPAQEAFSERGVPLLRLAAKEHLPRTPYAEYFFVHPPACVYDWYAEVLADELAAALPAWFAPGSARRSLPAPGCRPRRAARSTARAKEGKADVRELDGALEALAALASRSPDDPELWIAQADAQAQRGGRQEALRCLDRAEALRPGPGTRQRAAQVFLGLGEPARALRSLAPTAGAGAELWVLRAEAAAAAGDRFLARQALSRAEALRPEPDLRLRLAAVCELMGEPERARDIRESLPGRSWESLEDAAACAADAAAAGRRRLARKCLARSLELEPGPDMLVKAASLSLELGDRAQASAFLSRLALRPGPAAPAALRHRAALLYQSLGDQSRAASILRDLVQEYPRQAAYLKDLGISEYRSGEVLSAVRDLEAAVRLDPESLSARQSLEAALAGQGRTRSDESRRRPGGR